MYKIKQKAEIMQIVLASQSQIKIDAVSLAFNESMGANAAYDLIALKAPSNVNEQPIGFETMRGAQNRIDFIKAARPNADFYVSIENGLFPEHCDFIDYAVVTIEDSNGKSATTRSKGIIFPKFYVLQTRYREGGFKQWTVGKTMMEAGEVKNHADPHKCISGISRVDLINQATRHAVHKLKLKF